MQVDTNNLIGGDSGATQSVSERSSTLRYEDGSELRDVTVEGMLTNLDDCLLFQGTVKAVVELTCSRCLKSFPHTVEVEAAEEFSEHPTEEQFPAAETSVDLTPMVNTVVVLALPHTPVHDPGCQGLCPVCGKNLNEEPHTHPKEDGDNPFSVLKNKLH